MNAKTIITSTSSAAARAEAFTRWLDDDALPRLYAEAASVGDGAGLELDSGLGLELEFCGLPIEARIDRIDANKHRVSFVASQVCYALDVRDAEVALAGEFGVVSTEYMSPDPADVEAWRDWCEAVAAGDFGDGVDLVDESAARVLALLAARQDRAVAAAMELGRQH